MTPRAAAPERPDAGARVRIDKWVWAARFFKTRSLAVQAIDKGRVRVSGETVKPSRDVRVGDMVSIDIDGLEWELRVLGVSDTRGPAPVARLLYEETAAGRQRRSEAIAQRSLFREPANARHGRPTKRERRSIDKHGSTNDGGD